MQDSTLKVPFVENLPSDDSWLTLSQDNFPSNAADQYDVLQMLSFVKAGKSARDYLYSLCPYAVIVDDIMTVTLNLYVNVPSLDMPYRLTSTQGEISAPSIISVDNSFDLLFDHSKSENFPGIFAGTVTNEMPFFNTIGEQVTPDITVLDNRVTMSEEITSVLRCEGTITGFKHTITLILTGTPVEILNSITHEPTGETVSGWALENLDTTITAEWDGESATMELNIPSCIGDILEVCNETQLPYSRRYTDEEPLYLVYYSTCTGEILREHWEDE